MPPAPFVVFADARFPGYLPIERLRPLLPDAFTVVSADELAQGLPDGSTLVSFHGPYFPVAAWQTLIGFLERGGNLAWLGGALFTRPVRVDGVIEPEQAAYTAALGLGPATQLATPDALAFRPSDEATALFPEERAIPQPGGQFWAFAPKLTQCADYPGEMGSSGSLDTRLTPLIFAYDASAGAHSDASTVQWPCATPFQLVEQQQGRFQGGRWLLAPWAPPTGETWAAWAEPLRRMLALVAEGAQSFDARPTLACVRPGERLELTLAARPRQPLEAQIAVFAPADATAGNAAGVRRDDAPLETLRATLAPSGALVEQRLALPIAREPGLYRVVVTYQTPGGQSLRHETGYWVWDDALIERTRGARLTAGRDYLRQGERVFYVFGSTYMDSVTQRRFLSLPNPARWNRDLAQMRAEGVNLVRTGLWTGWGELSPTGGVFNEAMLRALDALLLTACRHDMQVIFTFFAFSPPAFGGENPWFDPRALQGQRDFVAALARRYAGIELLSWDLINEPSMGDPAAIFAERPLPSGDRFERAAFRAWLRERYTLDDLRLRWRLTPTEAPTWDALDPPQAADFDAGVRNPESRRMLRAADYTHFSQQAFRDWAADLVATIRAAGSQTLITVGQDEAGARPAAAFHAGAVDYTATHPWWNNDDLFSDLLLDKTPDRPHLAQETGVMLARDVDGLPWRSDEENALLLERKLYTALAARTAGVVQWLWHTNAYMLSDNENSIGLLRADGSAKPELATMRAFGRLTRALEPLLSERQTTLEVWALIPYAQWFLRAALGVEAIRRAVRALTAGCGVTPQLVGEFDVRALLAASPRPRLVIVPGAQHIASQTWEPLTRYVREGGTLLVSGALARDDANVRRPLPWSGARVEAMRERPVERVEPLIWADLRLPGDTAGPALGPVVGEPGQPLARFTFGQDKAGYVRKAHQQLLAIHEGRGTILWSGLPIELSDSPDGVARMYQLALAQAGVAYEAAQEASGGAGGVSHHTLALRDATLEVFISESSQDERRTLPDGSEVVILGARAGAVLCRAGATPQVFGGLRLVAVARRRHQTMLPLEAVSSDGIERLATT